MELRMHVCLYVYKHISVASEDLSIYYWLGGVACIYHGTVRRECYKMLLIRSRHTVTGARVI